MVVGGREFESRVAEEIEAELEFGYLGIDPACAKVFRQKAYPSRDRGAEIVFDIVIEIYRRGATQPFLIWVWECKDHKRPIEPGAVEKFHTQLQQIGSDKTKGTMVVRGKYRQSAINFAQNHGIGLARLVDERLSYVMECRVPTESAPPTQREYAAGLTAGLRASTGSQFYALSTNGTFMDDLGSLIKVEYETQQQSLLTDSQ